MGRVIVVLPLVAAVFGLFGTGPLSSVEATGDGVSVSHERHGIETLDHVKYAVLEQSGGISIIPR